MKFVKSRPPTVVVVVVVVVSGGDGSTGCSGISSSCSRRGPVWESC